MYPWRTILSGKMCENRTYAIICSNEYDAQKVRRTTNCALCRHFRLRSLDGTKSVSTVLHFRAMCVRKKHTSYVRLRVGTWSKLSSPLDLNIYHSRLIPWGSRGVSDISQSHPRFIKMTYLWGILQTWLVVSPSPPDCSLSQIGILFILYPLKRLEYLVYFTRYLFVF
jgi:hypothetical protein